MKKILLSVTIVGMALLSNAQVNRSNSVVFTPENNFPTPLKELTAKQNNFKEPTEFIKRKKTRASGKRYFNSPADMDTFLSATSGVRLFTGDNLETRSLWQDSNVNVVYTSSTGPVLDAPDCQSIYQILDPFASKLNGPEFYGQLKVPANYNVDSFGVICSYTRNPNKASVVDTLMVSFIKENQMTFGFFAPSANFADTVNIGRIKTSYAAKTGLSSNTASPTVITVKYPLTAASEFDTLSNGFNYYEVPANIAVTGSNLIGATVTFLSGEANIPIGDSIVRHNRMSFATFGEGTVSGTTFTNTNMTMDKFDYNMSGHTWTSGSFATGTGADRGYISAVAYSSATAQPLGWQYHWFTWTVSVTNTNYLSINNTNLFRNIDVSPNPAINSVNFNLNFAKKVNNIKLQIISTTGQVVLSENVNANSLSVKHSANVSGLAKGLYIYTITADGQSQSGKLSVN
jgi:Secretion system C-terminal sorting domain